MTPDLTPVAPAQSEKLMKATDSTGSSTLLERLLQTGDTTQQPASGKRKRRKRATTTNVQDAQDWMTPWVTSMGSTAYASKEQRLHSEILAFTRYIQPTAQERLVRQFVTDAVVQVLTSRSHSNARIFAFGSTAHDLFLPGGDIDLVVLTSQTFDDRDRKRKLFQFQQALRAVSFVSENIHVIHRARVPVISFETLPEFGSLKFDVSINGEDGLEVIPIIKRYIEELPALRPLVLSVKTYLSIKELSSAANGGLSSYSVICLVISFLQLNPKGLPEEAISRPLQSESLGTLLLAFFNYYGDIFPYTTSVVSVASRSILSKTTKGWLNTKQPDLLSIECLVHPENDIAKATSKITKVRQAFRDAHAAMSKYSYDLNHENVLGAVIGIPAKTIDAREQTENLIKAGSLERALKNLNLFCAPKAHPSLPRRPMPIQRTLRNPQAISPFPSLLQRIGPSAGSSSDSFRDAGPSRRESTSSGAGIAEAKHIVDKKKRPPSSDGSDGLSRTKPKRSRA